MNHLVIVSVAISATFISCEKDITEASLNQNMQECEVGKTEIQTETIDPDIVIFLAEIEKQMREVLQIQLSEMNKEQMTAVITMQREQEAEPIRQTEQQAEQVISATSTLYNRNDGEDIKITDIAIEQTSGIFEGDEVEIQMETLDPDIAVFLAAIDRQMRKIRQSQLSETNKELMAAVIAIDEEHNQQTLCINDDVENEIIE